jgi:hypothetical protein
MDSGEYCWSSLDYMGDTSNKEKFVILIQEADELAYRAAFACQKQAYKVITHKASHDFKDKYTKTEIVNFFKSKGKRIDEDFTLFPYSLIEPEHVVKHTLEKMVKRLWAVEHELLGSVDEVQLWLSPSDHSNFRYKVAEAMGPHGVGYKAGRGAKPYHLMFIRQLLIENYGAREIQGLEADDALGMFANGSTVLSHIDKDIDMIPGWHYNHVTQDIYYVEHGLGHLEWDDEKKKVIGRGLLFFYVQLLTGDSIDNIPGCKNPAKVHHANPPNFSAKEAYKLLQGVASEEVAFNYVAQMFQHTYGDRWHEAIQEMADLLYIVRADRLTGRQYLKNRGLI